MKTLYMTKGLPASGKSTWAKATARSRPNTKIVNKDQLRAMIDDGKWSHDNEKFILRVRDAIIHEALTSGKNVIVDDTNLAPKHESSLRELASKYVNVSFEIVDFTYVDLETCLDRDRRRSNYVGEKVIRDMYDKYLAPKAVTVAYNPALPDCIICDIDGTVADSAGKRGFYEWDKVSGDNVRSVVLDAVVAMYEGLRDNNTDSRLIFVSGRDGSCFDATKKWLATYIGYSFELLMRKTGDMRRDSIVKREIYEQHIKGNYNVNAIFDDRGQVIRECWVPLGFGDRIFDVGARKEF